MEGCVRPVKRERVPGRKSQLNGGSDDPPQISHRHRLRPSFDAASRPCPAPGTGLPGALNMLHDATMLTIPMARNADQGNAGMFHAVDVSGCSL